MPPKLMRLRTIRGQVFSLELEKKNFITLEFENSLVIVDRSLLDRSYQIGDYVDFSANELSQSESLRYKGLAYPVKWRATTIKFIKSKHVAAAPTLKPVSTGLFDKIGEITSIGDDFAILGYDDYAILIDRSTEDGEHRYKIGDKVHFHAVRLPLDKINLYYDTPKQCTWIATKVKRSMENIAIPSVPSSPTISRNEDKSTTDGSKDDMNKQMAEVPRLKQGRAVVMLVRPKIYIALRFEGSAVIVNWNIINFFCDTDDILDFTAIPMTSAEKLMYSDTKLDIKWKATKVAFVKHAEGVQGVGKIILVDFDGEFCFLQDKIHGSVADIFCTRLNFKPMINRPQNILTYFKEGDLINYAAKEQATHGARNVKWRTVAATSLDFALYSVKNSQGAIQWSARRINSCTESSPDCRQMTEASLSQQTSNQCDVSATVDKRQPDTGALSSQTSEVTAPIENSPVSSTSNSAENTLQDAFDMDKTIIRDVENLDDLNNSNGGSRPSSSECSFVEWPSRLMPLHQSTPNTSIDSAREDADANENCNDWNPEYVTILASDLHGLMKNNRNTTFDPSCENRSDQDNSAVNKRDKIISDLVRDCIRVLTRFEVYPVPVAKFLAEFLYLHRTDFQARLKPMGMYRFSHFQNFITGNIRYFVIEVNGISDIHREDRIAPTLPGADNSGDTLMNFNDRKSRHQPPPQGLGASKMPIPFTGAMPSASIHAGAVIPHRMYPPSSYILALMPPPVSPYLKMEELFTIINEECEHSENGIPIECLFEKVIDRIAPKNLVLNPIVANDFPGVLKRAIQSRSINVSCSDGMICSTRRRDDQFISDRHNKSMNAASQNNHILSPGKKDNQQHSHTNMDQFNSGNSPDAKLDADRTPSSDIATNSVTLFGSSIARLTLEDQPCDSSVGVDPTVPKDLSVSSDNIARPESVRQCLPGKTGRHFGFLRKPRNGDALLTGSVAPTPDDSSSPSIMTTPVDKWTEHLRLKKQGTIFIQPTDENECSWIRRAKEACERKWKNIKNLPYLLMLLRMIEPDRRASADWQAILSDFMKHNFLPRENVFMDQFGIGVDELLVYGFYEHSVSAENRGYIELNEIILPLNFVMIQADSVVDYALQLFILRKNDQFLNIRDVVFEVSDMIALSTKQSDCVKPAKKDYLNMNSDDCEQFIFDEILNCPLFRVNQPDSNIELASEILVVGSSERFARIS